MREILFRGKCVDTGRWYEGQYIHLHKTTHCPIGDLGRFPDNDIHQIVFERMTDWELPNQHLRVDVDPETVGQFTGLTDKNGKKIFEGDVFKFPDEIFESYYTSCGTEYNSWETENYGVIGFDEDSGRYDFVQYRFENNVVEADLHENQDIDFADFVRELEVIGNIHDNPELLEVNHD